MEHLRRLLDCMTYKFDVAAREIHKREGHEDANAIISPISLTAIATMLYYGVESGSSAQVQLEHVLRFTELNDGSADAKLVLYAFRDAFNRLLRPSKDGAGEDVNGTVQEFQLHLINRLFVQKGTVLKEEFVEAIKKALRVDMEYVDFFDSCEPNSAVEAFLREKMCNIMDSDVPADLIDVCYRGPRFVIANAAYFRSAWEVTFNKSLTKLGAFYMDTGNIKEVEFMTVTEPFPFYEDYKLGVKYLEFPYYHNVASLILTIPTKKGVTLDAAFKDITLDVLREMHLKKRMKTVKVTLPKIDVANTYRLRNLFEMIGVKDALRDDAHMTKMTQEPVFRASEGVHKCFIRFDEEGTFVRDAEDLPRANKNVPVSKNGGPTATGDLPKISSTGKTSPMVPNPNTLALEEFEANRPFSFAIRHNKSSLFLFSGRVMSA